MLIDWAARVNGFLSQQIRALLELLEAEMEASLVRAS